MTSSHFDHIWLTLLFHFFCHQKLVTQTIAVYKDSSMDSSACILPPANTNHQSHNCWWMMLVLINTDAQCLPQSKKYLRGTKPHTLQILAIPTSELNHYNWAVNHGVQRQWGWCFLFMNASLHINLNVLLALFSIHLVLPKILVTMMRYHHHFLFNLCMTFSCEYRS